MRGCETFAEFKIAVREELKNIPPAMLKTLVESMKRRLLACGNAREIEQSTELCIYASYAGPQIKENPIYLVYFM